MQKQLFTKTGWPLLSLTIALPILFWFRAAPLATRFNSGYMTLTSLGRLTGIIAMVLFCLNVILTGRYRWTEYIFGGLNKMYIAHHLVGGTALCVLLLHPILLSLRSLSIAPRDAARQLIPFLAGTPTTLGILSLWLFVGLMVMTIYIKLPYKTWLLSHKFMGLVLFGMSLHIILESGDIHSSLTLKLFSYGLLLAAAAAYTMRTLLPQYTARRARYEVIAADSPTPGVSRIVLKPKNKPLRSEPGQFIFLRLNNEGVSTEWHPFSIAGQEPDGTLTVFIKAIGSYTTTIIKILNSLVGSNVTVEGAYGKFNFHNFACKKQIWVAGGIGITPFLSMAREIPEGYQIDLYYSVRNSSEIIDWQRLDEVAFGNKGRLRLFPVLTDINGVITAEMIASKSGDLSAADILLCGPPQMMKALHTQFRVMGIRKKQLHSEEFSIL